MTDAIVPSVKKIRIWDGTETASVNASNQLEVAEANSADIETLLTSIKNTDGIKKITDTVTITGMVTANAGTNLNTSALATAANQLPDGHNVTVDNAGGAAAVNIQDGGNTITVDGTINATIQEPLSVDDNGSTLSVDDGAGSLTVDGTVTANAGTNLNTSALALETTLSTLNGKVTACNTTNLATSAKQDTIIGHVDGIEALLTTIDADTGSISSSASSIDGKITACNTGAVVISSLPNEGQQTMANSISVAIASNQSAIPVSDNGGSITVDGTVSATLSEPISVDDNGSTLSVDDGSGSLTVDGTVNVGTLTTITNVVHVDDNASSLTIDNADITSIKTAVETIDNAISGNEMQVDVVTSALPTGASTSANQTTIIGHVDGIEGILGTIDTDTGNIATSLGNIDNSVDGNYLNVNCNIAGTDIVGGAGVVAAGVQRVTLASDDPAVAKLTTIDTDTDNINTKLGTIDTDTGNIATSLGNMDNSVDGNYLNVNMNVAGTDVASNTGVLNAQTIRVTIATDDECNNLLGTIDTDTGNIATSTGVMDDWDNGASDGASVSGDVAHDSADAGEPVKIGCKAIDMTPNTEGEQGPSDVAANDRVNSLSHLDGTLVECVRAEYQLLTEIDQTYDADPTTATSSNYPCWQYRQCTFSTDITKANTPTDILFDIETSCDNGSSYQKFRYQWTSDWRYDDTSVGASGKKVSKTFPICCTHIRVKVTCTGTDGSNTFTIDNSSLMFRN